MLKVFILLTLSSAVFAQTRNANVCEGVTEAQTDQFRNDFASCEEYFWCDADRPVPAGPCRTGWTFDDTVPNCNQAATCLECPTDRDIAVAVAGDATCKTFLFCVGGDRTTEVQTCPGTLLFNRGTGQCDLAANVICGVGGGGGGGGAVSCTDDAGAAITGDVEDPSNCQLYNFCLNGVPSPDGPFDCGASLQFNPSIGQCDEPASRDPPCAVPPPVVSKYIPKVKEAKHQMTFRERIAKKLHF